MNTTLCITTAEAMRLLGIGLRTFRRLTQRGELKPVVRGHYSRKAIEAWVERKAQSQYAR